MTTTRLVFQPTAVLDPGRSPITGQTFASRRSTTEEQREEAVRHAAAWMAEHTVFVVEVEVEWTRKPATVLTVNGHAEHLEGKTIAVIDRWREADRSGRTLALSLSERHAILERELEEMNGETL